MSETETITVTYTAAQAEYVARALTELAAHSFGEPAMRREVGVIERQLDDARRAATLACVA